MTKVECIAAFSIVSMMDSSAAVSMMVNFVGAARQGCPLAQSPVGIGNHRHSATMAGQLVGKHASLQWISPLLLECSAHPEIAGDA